MPIPPECDLTHGMRQCGRLLSLSKPIDISPLTEDEHQTLQEGLRSSNACVLRRCPILLASVASRAPLLVVVDDAHWLDRSS